ncbi:MAG: hypothetical protein Q8R02_22925 [Hyphomonadaceae bacterium]|nr:hypothetical protein [Hyphomonadaceae bacterium]
MKLARIAVSAAVLAFACGLASAQEAWKAPRTSDGRPDLQGVWTNASLTTLERSPQFKTQAIPADRAAQMETQRARMMVASNARTNPSDGAPTDGNANAGYNTFWIDPGTHYGVVKGEVRSSWIVDPPDGRIPYTASAKKHFDNFLAKVRGTWDGPEIRPQGERCIVGFGSTGGPPMVNVLYNNNSQFVQTPGHVVITAEMIHDSRVIPIGEKRPAKGFDQWLGNSVGWWEGDTLVVETRNFHKDIRVRPNMGDSYYVGENATVTERFTRIAADAIHYEFTVADKDAFTRPWRAEMTFRASKQPMYEYACHEGNYALPGILAGARRDDREGRKTAAVGDAE